MPDSRSSAPYFTRKPALRDAGLSHNRVVRLEGHAARGSRSNRRWSGLRPGLIATGHYGLVLVQERAASIGATIDIDSSRARARLASRCRWLRDQKAQPSLLLVNPEPNSAPVPSWWWLGPFRTQRSGRVRPCPPGGQQALTIRSRLRSQWVRQEPAGQSRRPSRRFPDPRPS